MGGGDKALVEIGGRPLLAHVIARLRPQVAGLVLNANGDAARFASFGLPIVADDIAGFAGPLAGIVAGLDWLARERPSATHAVSIAADTPFIPSDLAARLDAARVAQGARLACAASGGWTHPVIGLWPIDIRHDLRRALVDEELRKIDLFTARYAIVSVEWDVRPFDPFFNVNAPEDVAEAERIIAGL
jgi:molybdopterin-guanine dinucleotide biosynthesis protein A